MVLARDDPLASKKTFHSFLLFYRSNGLDSRVVFIRIFWWLTLYLACITVTSAMEPLAKGIQDNSFLVEEAYNQEPGIVQHILNLLLTSKAGQKETFASFTQEWPIFSQQHQFSYTVPHTVVEDEHGFEDIRLNYRFQALMEGPQNPAFAPRFSLVVPTGDADKGFGHDRLGYEINLPFSKIVSDRWTLHFNAGGSLFPNVRDRDLWNYNLGASAIYAVSANFNLMIESVAFWEEDVDESRQVDRSVTALLSPGARYAFNLRNDAQLVVGFAVPIGLTSDSPEYGFFFYCSFEHPFLRPRPDPGK
jgi:Putative MetA-pathway of phenol degradation